MIRQSIDLRKLLSFAMEERQIVFGWSFLMSHQPLKSLIYGKTHALSNTNQTGIEELRIDPYRSMHSSSQGFIDPHMTKCYGRI